MLKYRCRSSDPRMQVFLDVSKSILRRSCSCPSHARAIVQFLGIPWGSHCPKCKRICYCRNRIMLGWAFCSGNHHYICYITILGCISTLANLQKSLARFEFSCCWPNYYLSLPTHAECIRLQPIQNHNYLHRNCCIRLHRNSQSPCPHCCDSWWGSWCRGLGNPNAVIGSDTSLNSFFRFVPQRIVVYTCLRERSHCNDIRTCENGQGVLESEVAPILYLNLKPLFSPKHRHTLSFET
mmetsp:Transcript_1186/g.2423  ORF Transcript_1186/g.2423 Transcript_1186/m.2423 type:complete len:238 (+) Transcript_1186:2511-3224(+)